MSKYTFDSDSSEKKLRSLIESFEKFKNAEPSSSVALHLSSEAWHLTDWTFKEFQNIHNFSDLGTFRNELYIQCDSLKIMHDLANSSKHLDLSRPKANIEETQKHTGRYSHHYSSRYNISRLDIILKDGTVLQFNSELEKVINFWKSYFSNTLNILI